MARFSHNPETGEIFIVDADSGEWRPASTQEIAVGRAGVGGQVAAGIEGATGIPSIADALAGTNEAEALTTVNPTAASIGLAATVLPLGSQLAKAGAGMALRLGRGGPGRRVATEIDRAGRQLIRRPSDVAGRGTTTGQVLQRLEAATEVIPGPNLLPLAQKTINQRRVNASFARAMGVTDDATLSRARAGVTDDILDDAVGALEDGFAQVQDDLTRGLTATTDQTAARTIVDEAIDAKLVPRIAKQVTDKEITGKELMAVRSNLTRVVQSNADFLKKEEAFQIIEEIDALIAQILPEAEALAFKETRNKWRLWATARRGRGRSPDGQINVRSIGGRLAENFGDDFRLGRDVSGTTPEINDFLRIVREGEGLDVGLPSSGTAERAALGALGLGIFAGN